MEPLWILKGLGFLALGIALFMLVTLVVMRLWNWLVPSVFNGPKIRFVQALGLLFLTRLLVGGFGGAHGGHWRGHPGFDRHRAAVCQPDERASHPSKTGQLSEQ
ncbi:hypothetical protein GCM10028803_34850 [Larkinella knui]|uniref:Uncharacterized protein n=1 Tax=Larkinella knui TaxID=2025310 RepID=A0A3P1CDH6_9BACT|nr:hypothetical protein [Larkinella knui]RRB11362.1 hypothetical protein EHT87_23015 [Larkinella knui]